MADSTDNIEITKGQWLDLYALTNPPIAVGTQILVQNVGAGECRLYAGAAAPGLANEGIPLPVYTAATNETADSGAFIYSVQGTRVNVRAA